MIFEADDLAGAVLFFSKQGDVSREMLFTEFQAVLDAYVPAMELASQHYDAVYVEIDRKYLVRRAVFFTITFTSAGFVDPGWALPLETLARSADTGPNLGAGPIQLACASQCPIHHYRNMLWDPDLRNGKGQFGVIRRTVSENRLCIDFKECKEADLEAKREEEEREAKAQQLALTNILKKELEGELRNQMAQMLKEQRLRAKTITNENEKALEELKRQHNARLEDLALRLEEKDRIIEEERQKNLHLKETIDGQAEKIKGLREYFEHKLESAQGEETEQIEFIRANYEAEFAARLDAETTELRELVQMRDVELLYRNEQDANLHDEITRLKQMNSELIANSGDELLAKLSENGISFVTFQPGAGHITLPYTEISRYLTNPMAYAAGFCGVSETQYQAWLEHYQMPICTHTDEEGNMCGANIERIENPADFILNETNLCLEHQNAKQTLNKRRA